MLALSQITKNIGFGLIVINWLVLIIYGIATLLFIARFGKLRIKSPLPALTVVYTIASAWFIGQNILHFQYFGHKGLEIANRIKPTPGPIIFSFIFIAGSLVATAFLCNCSRAFFILNRLEHGIYGKDAIWEENTTTLKKIVEFIIRTGCAVGFLLLENNMIEAAKTSGTSIESINDVAKIALILYLALLIWWFFTRYVLEIKKLGKIYLVLFAGGGIISLFMMIFSKEDQSTTTSFWFILLITVVGIIAFVMIITIIIDIVITIKSISMKRTKKQVVVQNMQPTKK